MKTAADLSAWARERGYLTGADLDPRDPESLQVLRGLAMLAREGAPVVPEGEGARLVAEASDRPPGGGLTTVLGRVYNGISG